MLGIGWTEFILIAVVLLIIVGPKHLPAMFRKLGKITAEFRAASRELRNQIALEDEELESPREIMRALGEVRRLGTWPVTGRRRHHPP